MSLLVTGCAGFIGSNFALDWAARSDEVAINLDKLTYAGNAENLQSLDGDRRHVFVRGDIGDSGLVASLLAEYQPRAVVNFAAEIHVDRSIHDPAEFIHTNIVGTFHLLETVRAYWSGLEGAARASYRFLHVSTDEVYGSLCMTEPPFTETHCYEPKSPYSVSKAASDHLGRAYHFPEKLIPLVILNALADKPLPIYSDGQQVRDWLYVEDHCSAFRQVLDFQQLLSSAIARTAGATVSAYHVHDPERYGVAELDIAGKVVSPEKKPSQPKSSYAVTGSISTKKTSSGSRKASSPRSVANLRSPISTGSSWSRLCSISKLWAAAMLGWTLAPTNRCSTPNPLIVTLENRQRLKVACPEKSADRQQWIDAAQLEKLAQPLTKNRYGQYLMSVVKERVF